MNKVLIIEDEEVLRQNLRDILDLEGYEVKVAPNGMDGIELYNIEQPDLVLCDIKMPKMDGFDVLKTIRDLPGGLTTAFIFLSAKVEHDDIRSGMNLGADDYLLKPVNRKDLLSAIETRLKQRTKVLEEMNRRINDSINGALDFGFDEVQALLSRLSKSERKVLYYVSLEKSTSEIADLLFISPKTVENHRHNISKKLDLKGGHSVLALALKIKPHLGNITTIGQ
ncbi:MAG: response regulator transcription factor [Bacteroidia bacterium]|jgi:DNA-binding NarL/FixJ family response regulator|nr:response regulator transcription factor [Bacteroidia bacterium]